MNFTGRLWRVALATALIVPGLRADAMAQGAAPRTLAEAEQRVKQGQMVWIRTLDGSEYEGTFDKESMSGTAVRLESDACQIHAAGAGHRIALDQVTTLSYKRTGVVRPHWVLIGAAIGLVVGLVLWEGDADLIGSDDSWLHTSTQDISQELFLAVGAGIGAITGLAVSARIPQIVTLERDATADHTLAGD